MSKENLFHSVPAGENPPKELNCLVEIPRGENNKYEYDKEAGAMKLDRVIYEPFFYPVDYGLIPQTWNREDNDPLDIFVFTTNPTFSGCVIPCRVIGVFHMDDTGESDDKIVAVPIGDPHFSHVKSLADINPHLLRDVEFFFGNYKNLQKDKYTKVNGWGDIKAAEKIIQESIAEYKKKFNS